MDRALDLLNLLDLLGVVAALLAQCLLEEVEADLHILDFSLDQVSSCHDALDAFELRIGLTVDLLLVHGMVHLFGNQANNVLWVPDIDELHVLVGLDFANEFLVALLILHEFERFLWLVELRFFGIERHDEIVNDFFVAI